MLLYDGYLSLQIVYAIKDLKKHFFLSKKALFWQYYIKILFYQYILKKNIKQSFFDLEICKKYFFNE